MRYAMPMCYADPAFQACIQGAADTPELLKQFDRLCGETLTTRKSPIEKMVDVATGKQDTDMRAFCVFVHSSIYLRLPDEAIHALRLTHQVTDKAGA